MSTLTDMFVSITQHPVFVVLHELVAIIGLLAIILGIVLFRHHLFMLMRQYRQLSAPALIDYATSYHAMSNSPAAQQKFIRNQLGKTVDWTVVVQYLGCIDTTLMLNPKAKASNILAFKTQDLSLPSFVGMVFYGKDIINQPTDITIGDTVRIQGVIRGSNIIEGHSIEKITHVAEHDTSRLWVGLWQGSGSDIIMPEEEGLDGETLLFNNNLDFRFTSRMEGLLEIRGNVWFQTQGEPVIGKFSGQGKVSQYNEIFMPITFTVLSVHDSSVQYNSFGTGVFRISEAASPMLIKGYLLSKRPLPENSHKIALIRVELKKSTAKT